VGSHCDLVSACLIGDLHDHRRNVAKSSRTLERSSRSLNTLIGIGRRSLPAQSPLQLPEPAPKLFLRFLPSLSEVRHLKACAKVCREAGCVSSAPHPRRRLSHAPSESESASLQVQHQHNGHTEKQQGVSGRESKRNVEPFAFPFSQSTAIARAPAQSEKHKKSGWFCKNVAGSTKDS
jgi:hypothetical protein